MVSLQEFLKEQVSRIVNENHDEEINYETEQYIKGLEAHLTKLVVEGFGSEHVQFSPQEKRGFNTATNEALNYLRGKLNE